MATLTEINSTTYKTVAEDIRETIIGDQKAETFNPTIEISPWEDSEDCLKIYKDISSSTNVTVDLKDKESLIWQADGEQWQFESFGNYVPKGIQSPLYNWNGVQFIIRIDTKPKINADGYARFSFKLAGHENMDFFLQPGEDSPEWRIEWKEGTPDWAEHSIAVYHKTKKNSSQKHNYKTGKICHILRPWVVDSEGNFTWGKWEIDIPNSTITKLIPGKAFDFGTFWKVDATFGNTSQGANHGNQIDGNIWVTTEGHSPAVDGTVDNLHGWLYASGITARTMQMALYNNSGKTLITGSESDSVNSGTDLDEDVTFPYIGSGPGVLAATSYDIAVWGSAGPGNVYVYDDLISNASYNDPQGSQFNWPDPYDTTNLINRRVSLYVEYTAGAGGDIAVLRRRINGYR